MELENIKVKQDLQPITDDIHQLSAEEFNTVVNTLKLLKNSNVKMKFMSVNKYENIDPEDGCLYFLYEGEDTPDTPDNPNVPDTPEDGEMIVANGVLTINATVSQSTLILSDSYGVLSSTLYKK